MVETQTIKIRMEIGPGIPFQLSKFSQPDAHAAVLKGFFQAMTAEAVYPGPEAAFTATHGGATVHVEPTNFDIGSSNRIPAVHHFEVVATVTLETAEETAAGGD